MKIYFIGQKGIPSRSGGVEKHVEDLATHLADAQHEVFVYTRPNYTPPELKEFKGVNLISLPSIGTKHLDAISHTFRACLDVVKRDVDVIHFHSIGPSSLIWLIKILRPEVPIISTFHTRCYIHQKWGLFARLYLKFGEFMACTFADVTTTVSRSLTDYANEKYETQTVYIPNGVNLPEKLPAKEIKKWGLEKGNYIVTVSRLVRHKGIHYLIDAYKQLKTDKKLVIVGDGSFTEDYVQELKQMVGNNKNIIFTGSQSGRMLNELFSNAYLFVQPSESEGLSIALLEAMSYENAVLISDIPENLEAAENVGFSFKDRDVVDLRRKLSYLLKNPELVETNGRMGKNRVNTYYNWKNISKDMVAVYNQAIIEKKSAISSKNLVKKFTSLF
ncbi:MAG: hypothetical protein UT48_C0019G0002 [Parcubacteria group bacterium GW2011_GWE2_39_37]|uniref:Glycosyltransferase n=1 Tax=Candidatus Falkowbacteria bacterium GW2011_GWF2_39_8 TaxID=1618642 RepID=A0A0G0T4S1_9BACT|nr:MAG: hypothetical protein UT48_C0019G0002 [Parcubacteria group bacterium GW2011_GWE2_39_37]KKR32812.1 MAG: hypothetical protein UT64_C0022G0011 [Candidatus Falkowbacteria bacterium GW2011_GWF2_39_8]